jgi:hypothetical protein
MNPRRWNTVLRLILLIGYGLQRLASSTRWIPSHLYPYYYTFVGSYNRLRIRLVRMVSCLRQLPATATGSEVKQGLAARSFASTESRRT